MPDGLTWEKEPHHNWWARAGRHRWSVHFIPGMVTGRSPELAGLGRHQVLIADEYAWQKQGGSLAAYYDDLGVRWQVITVPAGEKAKDLAVVRSVAAELADVELGPDSVVVGVGGSAIGDVVRMLMALWDGGRDCALLATTPLSAVDGDVGTKNFVDLLAASGDRLKNKLRVHRPALVTIADPDLFRTVPDAHVRSASCEIVKTMIDDPGIIATLEASGLEMQAACWSDAPSLAVLARATDTMLRAIQSNPDDKITLRTMNFGHFIGKTIELMAVPPMPHGWSVGICMAVTIKAAEARGYVSGEYCERLLRLMHKLDLPMWHPLLTRDVFVRAIKDTTRSRKGPDTVPVPDEKERHRFVSLGVDELVDAAKCLRDWQPVA
ncbi:3-dehydroquinate synthase family protein [Actinophytocola sp.]|uniref:3-dehydroquinate synthase family protein n=1 Tax=Actinophytocola sp. TaxID=1872138 RepID=UPI002ED313BC